MASKFKNNPKWVKRMKNFFTQMDLNKNNYLSIEDFELWVNNIVKERKPAPPLEEKLYEVVREYWGGCGLKPGIQLDKDQFVDKMAEFAVVENARRDKGEDPLLYKLDNVFCDVADTNHDRVLSLEEYEKMTVAFNFDAGTAKATFDIIDKNHNGELSMDELNEFGFKFWFTQILQACMDQSLSSWIDLYLECD